MEKIKMLAAMFIFCLILVILSGIGAFALFLAIPIFIYFLGQEQNEKGNSFQAWIYWIIGYLLLLFFSHRLAEPFFPLPPDTYIATFFISLCIIFVSWLLYIAYK